MRAAPDAELRRTRLPNGLTVLSDHVPGVRSVAFGAWVRAASLHESREEMGVSHFLEHLVFKGTEKRSAHQIALALETLGGSLDAYTSRDHTAFQARVLDEHLPAAADVIADLAFRPALRESDLQLERDVILEEIGMVDDTPDDLVFELHNAALWGDHPYGYTILGTRETVAGMPLDAVKRLHERAYHPGMMVVAAAGNVDHDALLETLERSGWMSESSRNTSPMPLATAPVPAAPTRQHVKRAGTQTHVVVGGAGMSYADPRRYALALVSMVLGDGMSSRLFQKVREELALAYSVHTFTEYYADGGTHGMYLGTAPDKAAKADAVVMDELQRLVQEGLPADELAAAKRQLKGQITLSLEGVSSRMYRAAASELYGKAYRPLDEILAEIDAIEPAMIESVCREFFAPERQTVLTLGPKK